MDMSEKCVTLGEGLNYVLVDPLYIPPWTDGRQIIIYQTIRYISTVNLIAV